MGNAFARCRFPVRPWGWSVGRVQQRDNMRVANIIKKHCPEWEKCPSNRAVEGYGAQRAYERKTEAELNAERFGVQGRLPNV